MKKIIAFILAFATVFGCVVTASAEENMAKLYNVYGDGMLFEQNEEAVFAGVAPSGAEITAELYNGDTLVTSGKSAASANGDFEVSFTAPSGGYTEYTVILKADSSEFATLENVVFGELWLASGQSNMMYPLGQAAGGIEMMANGEKLSKWLRVFLVPAYPENTSQPETTYADPQQEIVGARWITGEDSGVYGMSAVAYFFAVELMEELDMPVGVLNASLGGSSISSWLSREAIDGDSAVKNDLVSNKRYIEKSDWKANEQDIYIDMTANYNHKIAPLENFRPAGMIWYQGETDLMSGWSSERYARAFDLMQRSYTEIFDYKNGVMPIIYTQIASYLYSDDGLNLLDWNIGYSEMQKKRADSRAAITIYDVPLTFIPETGAIHPESKKEIGERMAFAAKNLVYGGTADYTAATVKSSEIRDGSVYVTFENAGDGLMAVGDVLNGFAVCGGDGVYVQANAEIVSPDTVRIWSESVAQPASASYAYCVSNMRSNLYASADGEPALPVGQFVTDSSVSSHYWFDRQWMDCDSEQTWHVVSGDEYNKFYSSWVSEGAQLSFGESMNVKSGESSFSVSPLMSYDNGKKSAAFGDIDTNYSDYGKMSFYIRNNGTADINLSEIRFYKNSRLWYSPAVEVTKDVEAVIPADGEWHCITVDLNRLYRLGNEGGASLPNSRLKSVSEIKFMFESNGESDIDIDTIRFAPSAEEPGIRFDSEMKNADTFVEKLCAFFVGIIGAVVSVFA